jgi:hypothetical protein
MCEETKCDWKCKKPTLCPRPKCELVCEKPACEYVKPNRTNTFNFTRAGCCMCNAANINASMIQAHESAVQLEGEPMSFIELVAHFKHERQEGGENCCACSS